MSQWWAELTVLNKAFYYAAVFFGVLVSLAAKRWDRAATGENA